MTFREDFPLFWVGILGVLVLSYAHAREWDRFTVVGTLAAVIFMVLYAALYGLP